MPEKRFWSKVMIIWIGVLTLMVLWHIILSPPSLGMLQINTVGYLYTQDMNQFSYPLYKLPETDYNQLINLNFGFTIFNLVCNESNILLLVLVHSSAKNYARRQTIRDTWGKSEESVKILFVLGITKLRNSQKILEDEDRLHNDIIQGNFLDSYKNITYKHVMVFKYVIYHCPQAKYILKTDDDVFVNMPTMKIFLTVDLSPYGANKILFCTPRRHKRAVRSYRSKWRVSFSEYPNRHYPTYCPGWNILYSPDVVFTLYKEAQKAKYFWIDDLHVTGTLAEKADITHTDIEPLVISDQDLRYLVDYSCNISKPFLYGKANVKKKEIKALWKFVTTHITPSSVLKEFKISIFDFLPFLKVLHC